MMHAVDYHEIESGIEFPDDYLFGEFHGFSEHSFEVLNSLASNPTRENYSRLESQLLIFVKRPIETLLKSISPYFEQRFPHLVETRKRITSNFRKNDYGRGGYYRYYWGAFYRKGLTRRLSPQLCIKVHPSYIQYGFVFGDYSKNYSSRLLQSFKKSPQEFDSILSGREWLNYESYSGDKCTKVSNVAELIRHLENNQTLCLMRVLPKKDAIDLGTEVIREVEHSFRQLMKLFLVCIGEEDPAQRSRSDFKIIGKSITNEPIHQLPQFEYRLPSFPQSIDELFQKVHLHPSCREAQLIRRVYDASQKQEESAFPFRQVILNGPPGTGKTMTAGFLAELIARKPENIERIQFHPSYSYEDFVGGLKPVPSKSGESYLLRFESGVFKRFCEHAQSRPQENFVMVIDEINRGNVSAIFGELMWALEYRNQLITLPFTENGQTVQFCIPSNLFLIGTMNSADRSIALMDYAFRRRFKFIQILPKVEVLDEFLKNSDDRTKAKVKGVFLLLNKKLAEVNSDLCIGHSYFQAWPGDLFTEETLEQIWELSILPLIHEYFYAESRVAQFSLKSLTRELEKNQAQTQELEKNQSLPLESEKRRMNSSI